MSRRIKRNPSQRPFEGIKILLTGALILIWGQSLFTINSRASAEDIPFEERRTHWAFQPLKSNSSFAELEHPRVRSPIDSLIVEKLTKEGLELAPRAQKKTLIRRLYLDLLGFPPDPEQVQVYLDDDSPLAWERLIDSLLASPFYGERWGRHWLDVVRYSDTNGSDENTVHGKAYRYRDYVIRAFNEDLPFDQFIHEQIAGDLILKSNPQYQRGSESLTGTGFLLLGPKVLAEPDKLKMKLDIVDEQIDTVGKAFLGMSIGCARCHDHKFDPIRQKEYYALAGVFLSTQSMSSYKTVAKWLEQRRSLPDELPSIVKAEKELKEIDGKIASKNKQLKEKKGDPEKLQTIQGELKKLKELQKGKQQFLASYPQVMAVRDEAKKVHQALLPRGDHRLEGGETVQRGLLNLLDHQVTSPKIAEEESGRLQLAHWLSDKRNPLTARVIVNRIWAWHFGRGLVSTPNDFGLRGSKPNHPELLDWLATSLIEGGWSIKSLHRKILLSSTYQSGRAGLPLAIEKDPEGAFRSRWVPRRIEAEVLRDSLLKVSGALDFSFGGDLMKQNSFGYYRGVPGIGKSRRRSVYIPVVRNSMLNIFSAFDYNTPEISTAQRPQSIVPQQAFFLMNNVFIRENAQRLAREVRSLEGTQREKIESLYQRVFSRNPSARELLQIKTYFEAGTNKPVTPQQKLWEGLCQTLMSSNEFIYLR